MLIKNFPMNGVPRGREQSNNYVKALDLKSEAEQVAKAVVKHDGDSIDLNSSDYSVVLSDRNIQTGSNIGWADITGVATYEGSKEAPESMRLQADVEPDRGGYRTLTMREDGDLMRYTRQSFSSDVVEHMVHDTATDTFNYFHRNPKGQFLPQQ